MSYKGKLVYTTQDPQFINVKQIHGPDNFIACIGASLCLRFEFFKINLI